MGFVDKQTNKCPMRHLLVCLVAPEKMGPKKSYFSFACEYVKLAFASRVTKKNFRQDSLSGNNFAFLAMTRLWME
jgi:hypothetical protein